MGAANNMLIIKMVMGKNCLHLEMEVATPNYKCVGTKNLLSIGCICLSMIIQYNIVMGSHFVFSGNH